MLRDVSIVVLLNAEIIDYLKQKSESEKGKIKPVFASGKSVLNRSINPEKVKRFDKEINRNEENNIDEKFPIHVGKGGEKFGIENKKALFKSNFEKGFLLIKMQNQMLKYDIKESYRS